MFVFLNFFMPVFNAKFLRFSNFHFEQKKNKNRPFNFKIQRFDKVIRKLEYYNIEYIIIDM